MAMRIELTIVWVWPSALPVIGKLEKSLIVLPAAAAPEPLAGAPVGALAAGLLAGCWAGAAQALSHSAALASRTIGCDRTSCIAGYLLTSWAPGRQGAPGQDARAEHGGATRQTPGVGTSCKLGNRWRV